MIQQLSAYLAQDRLHALAHGESLPDRTHGTALFADISGFTPLTEALTQALGARRGAEALSQQINQVFENLIAQVANWRGSVISFAGDAITCWFDDAHGPAALRAAAAALAMQQAMRSAAAIVLPSGASATLSLKVALASGAARRFVVGDPTIQLIDVLAGETINRAATIENYAQPGEVLIDQATADLLEGTAALEGWRDGAEGARYALLNSLADSIAASPWPALAEGALGVEQLRPWLLPAIFQRYQAGLGAFVNELRPAAALFARFSGIDYDGDNNAGAQLDTFIRAVQYALRRYEGTLVQLTIGDKGNYLYAAFGAPVAHEDDLQRAVLTAFELHQTATTVSNLQPLQVGISRGTLIAGAYGASTRLTYGAQGDEVNLSARLMMQAAPGETLFSGRGQRVLAETFTLEAHAPIKVKGKAESIAVFTVLGQRRRRSIRLEEPSYALPMIGRAAELEQLNQALDRALGGQGQIVAITAEAGVGKSRLVAEGIRLARQRGLVGYGGACLATAADSPYLVWEGVWRAFFDLDPEASTRKQLRMLEGAVEDLAPERVEALPLLGPLVGLSLSDNDFTRTLQPKERQGALHALLRDCLSAAAREAQEEGGGLLLVLEDLHWIDSASLDLLGDLAETIADLPVLILLAYRPAEQERRPLTRLQGLPYFNQIALDGLNSTATEDLIRAKLAQLFPARSGALPPELVTLLTERAQGNPFYLEELLNYLHDRAIDPYDPAALASVDLPETLYSLVLSRMDQLSAQQQALIKMASVIGRRFLVAWLHGAFGNMRPTPELQEDLAELERTDLTAPDAEAPEAAYLFKHVVTQQVAYESLSQSTRVLLHEQLAKYLEGVAADDLEPYLEPLAYHYDRTNNIEKQIYYHTQAGRAAAKRFANETAIAHLTRVLELLSEEALEDRFGIVLERERIYHIIAERQNQLADIETLLDISERLNDPRKRITVLEEKVFYFTFTGQAQSVLEIAPDLIKTSYTLNVRIDTKVYCNLGYALLITGSMSEAQDVISEGLSRTDTDRDLWSKTELLHVLGFMKSLQGEYLEAQKILEEALEVGRKVGNRKELTILGTSSLFNILALGNFSSSHYISEQILENTRMIGDVYGDAWVMCLYGLILCYMGRFSESIKLMEKSYNLFKNNNDLQGEGFNESNRGIFAYYLADYDISHVHLQRAKDHAKQLNNPFSYSERISRLGLVHHAKGAHGDAIENYKEALLVAQQAYARHEQAMAHTLGGLTYYAMGNHEEAEICFNAALDLRRELQQTHLANEPLVGLARLELERHRQLERQYPGLLEREHLNKAVAYANQIMPHITNWNLHGTHDPIDICLAVHEVLTTAGDPRADQVLDIAYTELLRRANTIDEPATRERYLARRPHQQIIALKAKR
ncbi:MAG: adenylate/guanylate cyclase domain-containing protein [Roseiflexaceae bacterium]